MINNMKNILKYIFLISVTCIIAISCRDEDAVRFPDLQSGANARVVINPDHSFFSLGDIATTYVSLDIYSQNNDIDEIVYTATYNDVSSSDEYPPTEVLRLPGSSIINGKIADVRITPADLAVAFNLPGGATYLGGGDSFIFTTSVKLTDGRTIEASTSAPSITGGTNPSFTTQFTLAVACPSFEFTDAVGTFSVSRDDLEVLVDPAHVVEIVAGPGENQLTLKDLFGHPQQFDIIITVDPETSAVTVEKQEAWDSGVFGYPYGIASIEGEGTFFTCAGFLTLSLEHTVDAGSFGFYTFDLTKN